jgi:Haem-binding domain
VSLLTRIGSEARTGEMPMKQYLILHPSDRLTANEEQLIYDWAKSERGCLPRKMSRKSEEFIPDAKKERP